MSRVATDQEAGGTIEEEILCFTVQQEEDEDTDDWIDLESHCNELLATRPPKQPMMVPIPTEGIIKEQNEDSPWENITRQVNMGSACLSAVSEEGLLVPRFELQEQIEMPETLGVRIPYMTQYPVSAAHPGWQKNIYLSEEKFLLVQDSYRLLHNHEPVC